MTEREVATRYTIIATGFDARVDGCRDDDWRVSTPCPDWTAHQVLEHVVDVHRRTLALLDDTDTRRRASGDDAIAEWKDATTRLQATLRDPERAERVVTTPYGEMPLEDLVSRLVCSDTLVHTWDLARATGQDERLDPHAVEVAWTWMEPAGDRLRASGAFGPAVTPPPDADTQTRLLCFLGRAV
jgi:uncharacterized protein (TIGR03086 family)